MREYNTERDPAADPELREALGALDPAPTLGEADWDAMRARVREGAALPLARRRATGRLGRPVLHWTVPAAAAAGLAALVWTGLPGRGEPDSLAVRVGPSASAEEVFQADLSEAEFRHVVSGRAETDALLQIAVGDS